jgi:hypothetical protein
MAIASLSASDGFVIAMLSIIGLSLGVVALLFFCMRRSAARRDDQVDELLEEVAEEERREKLRAPAEKPQAEPWERDGDWWKK